MIRRVLPISMVCILFVGLAAGCQQEEVQEKPRENAKILLFWNPDIEFAPFYAAQKQGFYQDEGLNVELAHGGYDANGNYIEVLPAVLDGQMEFGLATGDSILLARARGEPVVAIGVFLQNTPTGFFSLAEKQITGPEDLKGKRIWTWGEDVSYMIFFRNTGLQSTDVTLITDSDVRGETGYDGLIDGTVDAMIGYIYYEPNALEALGYPNNFILFNDYGVEIYPDVIFTTEQMIREKPEVVQAFVNGTLRGINYALERPNEMAEYIKAQYGDQMIGISTPDLKTLLIAELLLAAPVNSAFASRPGMMSLDTWQATQEDMLALDLLNEPLDLSGIFDTRFVEAYYASQ